MNECELQRSKVTAYLCSPLYDICVPPTQLFVVRRFGSAAKQTPTLFWTSVFRVWLHLARHIDFFYSDFGHEHKKNSLSEPQLGRTVWATLRRHWNMQSAPTRPYRFAYSAVNVPFRIGCLAGATYLDSCLRSHQVFP